MNLERAIDNLIDRSIYYSTVITVEGTQFTILGRKANGFGIARIEKALTRYWPLFIRKLGNPVHDAAVIDCEEAIGGGPMDNYVLGIYSSPKISPEFQQVIYDVCGFSQRASTNAYIESEYSNFSDPVQAYVDEIVSHELGHLYFGWGALRVTGNKDVNNIWFHLGMGMVYDREIWAQLNSKPSPLIQSVIDRYSNHFSKMAGLDAKLIGADTSRDSELGLNRIQTLGHGKAFLYLNDLRQKLGVEIFDGHIRKCITNHLNQIFGYEEFIAGFNSETQAKIKNVETSWKIR